MITHLCKLTKTLNCTLTTGEFDVYKWYLSIVKIIVDKNGTNGPRAGHTMHLIKSQYFLEEVTNFALNFLKRPF